MSLRILENVPSSSSPKRQSATRRNEDSVDLFLGCFWDASRVEIAFLGFFFVLCECTWFEEKGGGRVVHGTPLAPPQTPCPARFKAWQVFLPAPKGRGQGRE